MERQLSVRARLLVAAARLPRHGIDPDIIDGLVSTVDLDELWRAARRHGLAPLLWHLLQGGSADEAMRASPLRDAVTSASARHLRALSDLELVGGALDRAALPWVTFKGPTLAELGYGGPGLRDYDDLDVMVPPDALGASLTALEAAGAQLLDRNWPALVRDLPGELHLRLPSGGILDLHWHLVNERARRVRTSIRTEEVMAATKRTMIAGISVNVLEPAPRLAHLSLHAALSGGDRLSWLVDIDRAVENVGRHWGEVLDLAFSWGVRVCAGTVWCRASRFLGAPVPEDVLVAAVPRVWAGLVSTVDSRWPVPELTGTRSPARLVARAAGESGPSSFGTLLEHVASAAREGLWRGHVALGASSRSQKRTDHAPGRGGSRSEYLRIVEHESRNGYGHRRSARRR